MSKYSVAVVYGLSVVYAAAAVVSGAAGCGGLTQPINQGIQNASAETNSSIDDAIRSLNMDSDQWQSTLENLVKQLDPKSLLRNEVQNLLSDSIGVANAGALCTADFIGERAAKVLKSLLSSKAPAPDPTVCEVVPPVVEFAHWQSGDLPKIDFYGYDLDPASLEAVLVNGKDTTALKGVLAHTSRYQLAINLGANGVKLTDKSSKIELRYKKHSVAEIAIAQPKLPPCETKTITVKPNALTLTPDTVGKGDNEFDGNGPLVHASYKLTFKARTLTGTLTMDAIEAESEAPHKPEDDFTHFFGHTVDQVTTIDKGWQIVGIEGASSSKQSYYDSTPNVDDRLDGGNGPVAEWLFRGDQDGDDLGYTNVTIKMNPIKLVAQQIEGCIPDKTKATKKK